MISGNHAELGTAKSFPKKQKVPAWWEDDKAHIYVEGYGFFDTGHIRRGWNSGTYLTGLNLEEGGVFPMASNSEIFGSYVVYYSVSANVTEDQLAGVLYGLYTDFELSYEQHQGTRLDSPSSFAPEDLPSDHIGFWAAINAMDVNEIPFVLERLGEVSQASSVDVFLNMVGSIRNYEFLPMAPQMIDAPRGPGLQLKNVPWPSWLEINPIPSGPNTWQRN